MNRHPLTLAYIRAALERPGMYMGDGRLRDLELQVHAFDTALIQTGVMGVHEPFNAAFRNWLARETGRSACQGWAVLLEELHGPGRRARAGLADSFSTAMRPRGIAT